MHYQNIIVWAWISGITIAQQLAEQWEKCLIIEKRNHIGGNCYDYYDENGILVHKYGPHLFHTNFEDVWNYLNRFTKFNNYQHRVLWYIDGNLVPIPFNLNSLYWVFSQEYAKKLESTLLQFFNYNDKVTIQELRDKAQEENNEELQFIADYIFEKVFKNYTIKQWQITPEEIDPNVLKRVPIMISRDDRYFPWHKFQWQPIGWYTQMFEKMVDSPLISIMLNTDYKDIIDQLSYNKLIITSPMDEYFGYKYGKLEYKKTAYILETQQQQLFQKATTINYPNDHQYTRITEMKHMYPEANSFKWSKTVICTEFPWVGTIDAYPVENTENREIYNKYLSEAEQLGNVYFIWRLANYKYQDMDITFKNALDFEL